MAIFKQLSAVPHEQVRNFRNDMYLMSEAIRIMLKSGKPELAAGDVSILKNYKGHIGPGHAFYPAVGKSSCRSGVRPWHHGGWKRIRGDVGEKIGKNHLTR